jgi:hypothetical protein
LSIREVVITDGSSKPVPHEIAGDLRLAALRITTVVVAQKLPVESRAQFDHFDLATFTWVDMIVDIGIDQIFIEKMRNSMTQLMRKYSVIGTVGLPVHQYTHVDRIVVDVSTWHNGASAVRISIKGLDKIDIDTGLSGRLTDPAIQMHISRFITRKVLPFGIRDPVEAIGLLEHEIKPVFVPEIVTDIELVQSSIPGGDRIISG